MSSNDVPMIDSSLPISNDLVSNNLNNNTKKYNTQTTLPNIHNSTLNSPSPPTNPSKSRNFLKSSKIGIPVLSNTTSNNNPESNNSTLQSAISKKFPSIMPNINSKDENNVFKVPSLIPPPKSAELTLLTKQEQQKLDEELRNTMQTSTVNQQDNKNELIISELEHLSHLCTQEQQLINNYKELLKTLNSSTTKQDKMHNFHQFHSNLRNIVQKKGRTLGYVLEGVDTEQPNVYSSVTPISDSKNRFSLFITQQPPETAVANRYLLPAPQLSITPNIIPCNSTFIVSVSLSYHGASDIPLKNTIDGKQDVLQGIKRITVDSSNHVIFTKLKIMEVSSKHRHQPFCLVYSLEEYRNDGSKIVLSQVKTAPFHVQSRPNNKRKSTGSIPLPPAKRMFFSPSQHQVMLKGATSSLPNLPTLENERNRTMLTNSTGNIANRATEDCNYIDITDLLVLPQKEAARKLGISESMLCKRFKECTRRKWPYRYLRKIDKVIAMLELQQKEGTDIGAENEEKLIKFSKEREECLKPVRIRITSYDKVIGTRILLPPPNQSPTRMTEDTNDVVETLQNLGNKPIISKPSNTQTILSNNPADNKNEITESNEDKMEEDTIETHQQ